MHEINVFAQYLLLVIFSIFLLQWSVFVCCSVQYLLVAVDPHRFTILVFGCKHTWDRLNTITCLFLLKSWPLLSWVLWMFGILKFKTFRFMWLKRLLSKSQMKCLILEVSNDYKYKTYTLHNTESKANTLMFQYFNALRVSYDWKVLLNIIHNFLFRVNGVHYIWGGAPASLLTNTINLFLFSALFSD